jgi:hypothetical protein
MSEVTRGNPGAHHIIKDRHLQNTVGLHDFPGSVYLIPGFCDKFKNTKRKVTPRHVKA